MTSTAVVVPFASEDPQRIAAWKWVRNRYETDYPEWEIVTGTCETPFCKALAVQDALSNTDADLLVVADSDVWCADLALVAKVADGTYDWALPHRQIYRLNRIASQLVYDGADIHETASRPHMLAERWYDGMVGGGIIILPRDLYERVPLDPLFQGWGGEDESWGRALKTLAPRPSHGSARLWHLFHEPQPRMNRRMGNVENRKRTERYIAAEGNPTAMKSLVGEARCLLTSSSEPS